MDVALWLLQLGADVPTYGDDMDEAVDGQVMQQRLADAASLIRTLAEQVADAACVRRTLQYLVVGAAGQLRRTVGVRGGAVAKEGAAGAGQGAARAGRGEAAGGEGW